MDGQASPTTKRLPRAARIYSDVVSPPVIIAVLGWAVAWTQYPFWKGLAWGAAFGVPISGLPMLLVAYLLKSGRIGDLHIQDRRQRNIPYLSTFVGSLFVLFLMSTLQAAPLLRDLSIVTVVAIGFLGLINLWWLISNHAATIVQAAVFVGLAFGLTAGLILLPFVLLTVAARLILKRHSVAQLIAGVVLGAAIPLALASLGFIR